MPYPIQIIDSETKHGLYSRILQNQLFTRKANIYGCCIKFLTGSRSFTDIWSDNFFTADENNRSHGRLLGVEDPTQPLHVKYDPLTKTAFAYNFDYYGWIKSLALAITGDLLEDAHEIHSVHGAALDVQGSGVALIAPSGTGKTTHSWGMLRNQGVRLVSDDWFFVRLYPRSAMAYGSEKNNYIDADLGKIWPDYRQILEKVVLDNHGRAVVNARWVVGTDGVVPMTTMKKVILLKRDFADSVIIREISLEEAMTILLANNFFNPHLLVTDERKLALRTSFFRAFLEKTQVYLANTAESPMTVQDRIFKVTSQ